MTVGVLELVDLRCLSVELVLGAVEVIVEDSYSVGLSCVLLLVIQCCSRSCSSGNNDQDYGCQFVEADR